jgi:hypothetical protein
MKIRPEGAELFHADGRTDMTKLTVAVQNIANALKKCLFEYRYKKHPQNSTVVTSNGRKMIISHEFGIFHYAFHRCKLRSTK